VALALALATSVNELLWIPLVGFAVWLVLWRATFSTIENAFSLLGLTLVVFAVAVWQLSPDWESLWAQASQPSVPSAEGILTYFYYAVALFGAAMTPYEVFFFSSGGVEEHWDKTDLRIMRANVFVGFPLGGVLSLAIAASAYLVLFPAGVSVDTLGQVGLPVAVALGKLGLAFVLVGFFAATFGAASETGLSVGYSVAQYFGWQLGKVRAATRGGAIPRRLAARSDHRRRRPAHDGRPDQGNGVLGGVFSSGVAADLLPGTRRGQRC
jgi:manganese transport protein